MLDPAAELADLTPAWLTSALRLAGIDGTVTDVRSQPVGTGQMSGSFRLALTWSQGSDPRAPQTLVAKLASPDPEVRSKAGATAYVGECRFYSELASSLPVPTPQCWYSQATADGSYFTLLLEDCAPAEQGEQIEGCSAAAAEDAIKAIASLHAATWCDSEVLKLPYLVPLNATTAPYLQGSMGGLVEQFVARSAVPDDDAAVLFAFGERIEAWFSRRSERFSLLHNDYRLDNLLFDPRAGSSRPVTVVDWQSLSAGLPARDVAYFVATGLEVGLRREAERDLIGAYATALVAAGVSETDVEPVWDDYVYGLFQAPLINVLGSMNSVPTERGNEMFRVTTGRACAAIRELDALDLLDAS